MKNKIWSQTYSIYNNNEVLKIYTELLISLHKWINELFSEENQLPRRLFAS